MDPVESQGIVVPKEGTTRCIGSQEWWVVTRTFVLPQVRRFFRNYYRKVSTDYLTVYFPLCAPGRPDSASSKPRLMTC